MADITYCRYCGKEYDRDANLGHAIYESHVMACRDRQKELARDDAFSCNPAEELLAKRVLEIENQQIKKQLSVVEKQLAEVRGNLNVLGRLWSSAEADLRSLKQALDAAFETDDPESRTCILRAVYSDCLEEVEL